MRETTALYKSLLNATGHFYDVELVRDGTTYGMDSLKSIEINQALYTGDGPQIGHIQSAECKVTLIESSANWPRMAAFSIRVRLSSADGAQKSEWISMGTYYTDERSETKYGDLSITAFDGMLLLEKSWTDKISEEKLPTSWPITGRAALDLLTEFGGVTVDNPEDIDNTVSFVGLDTTSTVRSTLGLIAAGNGYNCQMTADGHIRFVGMAQDSDSGVPAIAGIAIVGISVAGTSEEGEDYGAGIGKENLGMNIMGLDFSPKLAAITGVELSTEDGTKASAGDETGYVLKADCAFSNSDIAAICLSRVQGLQYAPFAGTTAILNPAAEVGDLVLVGTECYQMVSISWTLGKHITANIEAPYEEEVDHEFKIESESARTLRKALQAQEQLEERVYSSIEQNADRIMMQVGQTYATQQEVGSLSDTVDGKIATVQSSVTQTKDALEVEIQSVTDDFDELRMHYRFDENGETIGKENSAKSVRIANDGIDMLVNQEKVVTVNQNEMLAPRKVTIPFGGSFQIGGFLWQPRSSGNMSLLWVGE